MRPSQCQPIPTNVPLGTHRQESAVRGRTGPGRGSLSLVAIMIGLTLAFAVPSAAGATRFTRVDGFDAPQTPARSLDVEGIANEALLDPESGFRPIGGVLSLIAAADEGDREPRKRAEEQERSHQDRRRELWSARPGRFTAVELGVRSHHAALSVSHVRPSPRLRPTSRDWPGETFADAAQSCLVPL